MLFLLRSCVTSVKLLYLSKCQFLQSNEMVGSRSMFSEVLDRSKGSRGKVGPEEEMLWGLAVGARSQKRRTRVDATTWRKRGNRLGTDEVADQSGGGDN